MTTTKPPKPPRPNDRVGVAGTPDRPLISRDAVVVLEGRSLSWVRARFQPVACDKDTGTLLLDANEVQQVCRATPRRQRRRGCADVAA